MELCKGTLVAHPAKPEWGVGEVLQLDESHIRICLESAGEKTLDLRYVRLEAVVGSDAPHTRHIGVLSTVDLEKVRALCKLFIADLRAFHGLPNYPLNPREVLDTVARKIVQFAFPQTEVFEARTSADFGPRASCSLAVLFL